ncbi:hypothetical protein IFO70_30675 [Phormidium tenue FACHB-886]|nr:hypothetical protein [Phormidium tenue FACHB-886]
MKIIHFLLQVENNGSEMVKAITENTFVAAFLIALLRVKTVNFAELVKGFSGKAQTDSHYKRLQRFFRSSSIF